MALWERAARSAEDAHEPIASVDRVDRRARLIGPASSVHFAGRDAGDPHLRSLGAPYGPVPVPHCDRSAIERCASRYDLSGEIEEHGANLRTFHVAVLPLLVLRHGIDPRSVQLPARQCEPKLADADLRFAALGDEGDNRFRVAAVWGLKET